MSGKRINITAAFAGLLIAIYAIGNGIVPLAKLIKQTVELKKYVGSQALRETNGPIFWAILAIAGLVAFAVGLFTQKAPSILGGIVLTVACEVYSIIEKRDTISMEFKALGKSFDFSVLRLVLASLLPIVLYIVLLIMAILLITHRQVKALLIAGLILTVAITVIYVLNFVDVYKIYNAIHMSVQWDTMLIFPVTLMVGMGLAEVYMTFPNDWVKV